MDNYSNRDSSGSSSATIASCCRLIGLETTASSPVSWWGSRKKCAAAATAARALPLRHKVSRPALTSKLIVPLAVATLLLHLIAVISLALSVSVQQDSQSAASSLTLRKPSSDANSLPITYAKFGTHLAPLRRLVSLPHAWIGTRGPSRGELGAGHRRRHHRKSRCSLSLPLATKSEDERSISEQTHGPPPIEIATGTSGQQRVQVINSRREFTSSSLTSEAPSPTIGTADVSSDAYAPRRRARGGSEQSILIRSRRNQQQQEQQQQQQRPNKQRLGDGSQVSSSKQQHLVEQMFRNKLIDLTQKYMTNRAIGDRAYYVLLVIYALLITFGTISNLLICLTVILKPKILSPRNIFIVNLAGSDLLLCVFTMPFSFIEISMKMWQMGLIPCKLVAGLQATSIFVSTISITAIALDRYKVIVYPTHHETASGTRYAALLLASVWFGALLLSMPLFWFRTVEHYGEIVHSSVPFALPTGQQASASSPLSPPTPSAPLASNLSGATLNAAIMSELPLPPPPALYANDNYQANSSGAQNSGADTTWMQQQQQQQQSLTDAASEAAARAEDTSRAKFTDSIEFCIEAWPFDHGRGIYSVISMIFQYVLPITIVSVVYTKISHKLQKRLLRRQRLTQLAAQQKRQLNLIRRTHTMLVSVSLVFGLSWLPLNLLNVISDFSPGFRKLYDDQSFRVVFAVCHLIGCSSACSNPILYGFLNENFRKEFRQVYEYYGRMLARLVRRLLYSCYHCWLWCLCCCACCPPDNKPGGGDATTSASGTTRLGSTSNKLQSSFNESYSPAAQRLKSALYSPDDQLVVHVDELSRSDFDSGQSVTTSGSRSYDDEDDDYYDDEDYYDDYDGDYYENSTGSNLSGSSLDRSSTTWRDNGKTDDRHRRRRLNEPSGAQISGSLMNLAVVGAQCNKRICSHSMRSLHQPNEQQQAALGASTNSSTKCERLASGEQQLLTTTTAVAVKADGNGGGQMPSASSCNCIQAQQTDSVDGSRKLSSQTATSFSRHTMGRTMRLCLCISDSSSLESIDLGARAVTVSPDGLVSIRMNDMAKTNGRELQDASGICRGDNIGHGDDDEQRRQRRRVERLRRYRRRAIERAAAAAAAAATSSGHQRHELVQLKCECKCHSDEQAAPKLRATKVEVDSGGQQAEVVVVSGRAVETGGEQIGFAGHSKQQQQQQQLITKQAENNKTTQVKLNNDVPPPPPPPTGTGRRVWLRFLGARAAPEVKSNRPTEAVQVSGQVVATTSASNSSSSAAHSHSKPLACSPPAPDLAQATLEQTEAEARASRQGDRFIVSKSEQVTYEIRASETNNEANNGTTIGQEKSGQQLKGPRANCSQMGQDCAVERRPLAARQCLNCKHSSGSGAAGSGPLSIVINGVDGGAPKSRDEQMRQMRRRRRRWRRRQQQQQRRLHQQAAHGLLVGHGHGGEQQPTDRVASGSLGVAGATGAAGVPGTLRRKSNARTSGGGETKLRTRRYRLANWVSFNCLRGAGFQRGPVLARTRGTSKRGSWMKMSQRLRRAWPTYGRTCSSLDNQDKIDNSGGGGGGINIGAERGPANRLFGPLRRTFTMSYSSTAAPQLSGECSSVARQKIHQPQCGTSGGGGEQKILVAAGSGRRRAKTVGQASESSLQSQHSHSASGHRCQQLARSGFSSNQKRKQALDRQQDNSRQQASVDGGRVSGSAAISVGGGGKQVGTVYLSIDMPRSRGDSLVSLSNDKSTSVVVMAADELSQARELAAPASPQPPSSCPGQDPALDVESEVAPKSVCKQLPPASVSQFSFASNQLLPGAGSSSSCMAAPDYSPAAHNMPSPVTGPSATNKRLDSGARCDEDQGNMSNLAPMEGEIATETKAPNSESAGEAAAWPSGGAESSAPDDASRRRRININNQSGAGQCTGGAGVVTSASVHSIAQSNKYASPSPSSVGQQSSSTTTKIAKNNNSMQASMSEPETDICPTTSACCQEIAQRAQIGSKWPHTTSQSVQQSSSENPNHHHHQQQQHIKQSSSVRIELCKASPEPPDASHQMGPNESQAPQNRQNLSPSTSSSSSSASSSSASSRQSSSLSTTGASSSINSCLAHSGSFSSVSSRTTGSLCTCSSSSCQLNLGANASICSRAERVRANTTATTTTSTTTTTTQIEASGSSSSKPPFKPPASIQVNNNKGSSNGDNNSRRSGSSICSQIQAVSRGASTEAAPRGAQVAQRQHTPPRAMGRGLRTQRTASATAGSVTGQSHQLVAAAVRASARRHAQAVGVVGDGTAPMLATSCSGSLATLGGANNNGPQTIGRQLAHQQQRRHQPGLSASMVLTKQKTSTSGNSSLGTRQSSRNDSSQTGLDTRNCSAMNLNDQSFETSNTCATTTCETASSCSMFTNTTSTTASRSSLCEEIDVAPEDQSTRADSFSGSDDDDEPSSAMPISVLDRDVEATMTTTTTGSGDEHDKESPTPPTVVSAGDDKQSSQSTGTTDSMDNTPPTASKLCDDERTKCVDVVGSTQVALVCNGTQQVHVDDSTTRKQAPRLSGNSTSTRL